MTAGIFIFRIIHLILILVNRSIFLEDYLIKIVLSIQIGFLKPMVKKFEQVSNKTILCSGTVLGNYENIKEYLFLMKKYFRL